MKRIMTTMAMLAMGLVSIAAQVPDRYNFKRACEALSEGNTKEAQKYLLRDIEANPEDGYSPALMIRIYRDQKQYGNALQMANKALKYLPKDDAVYRSFSHDNRYWVYLSLGDTARALADNEMAMKYDPSDVRLHGMRGQVLANLGRFDEAEKEYKILMASEEERWRIAGLLDLSNMKIKQKLYAEAVEYTSELIEAAPDVDYGYALRAWARYGMEDYDNAITDLLSALSLNMRSKSIDLLILLTEKAYDPLIRALEEKANAEKDRQQLRLRYCAGIAHENHGAYAEAIEAYTASQNEAPSGVTMYRISQCYKGMGKYEKASESIEEALSLSPDRYDWLTEKARFCYDDDKPEEAIGVLDQLIFEHPEYSNLYYAFHLRGCYKKFAGNIEEAIEDITISMALYPEYAYNYLTRGEMYKTVGRTEEAEADFRKGIELDQKGKDAQIAFYCYFYLGDNQKAIETLEPTLTEEDKGNYYDAACLYSLMGDTNKSLRYLRRAFELGYRRFAHIRRDGDLKNLRATKGFEKLMKEYEEE